MADSLGSSSNALYKDREFYVREIPSYMNDWDLFRIFRRYGLVNSVKIPTQNATGKKYGFVSMIELASADTLRKALIEGRLLVDKNISLVISEYRVGAEKGTKQVKHFETGNKGRSPTHQRTTFPNNLSLRRSKNVGKEKLAYVAPKLCLPDLPLNHTLKVLVVPSPFPPNAEEEFVFHVFRLDYVVSQEYDDLQRKMQDYCEENKCIALLKNAPEIKVGDPLIYSKDAVAYRGIRTGVDEIFLMDINEGMRAQFNEDQVWLMQPEFCDPPTLIASCLVAGVEWCEGAADHYERYRDVLVNWSIKEGGIYITVKGYHKSHSLVEVFGNAGILADILVRQGVAKKNKPEDRRYDKRELLSLQSMVHALPECVNKNDAAGIILV